MEARDITRLKEAAIEARRVCEDTEGAKKLSPEERIEQLDGLVKDLRAASRNLLGKAKALVGHAGSLEANLINKHIKLAKTETEHSAKAEEKGKES